MATGGGRELEPWTAFVRAARLLAAQLDRELQSGSGLSLPCYELLGLLERAPQGMRMNELAEATHSSPSRITHAIDLMARRGWLERRGCDGDRRGCAAALTGPGAALLRQARAQHDASLRAHLLDHLTARQLDELCSISNLVLDHLCSVRPR